MKYLKKMRIFIKSLAIVGIIVFSVALPALCQATDISASPKGLGDLGLTSASTHYYISPMGNNKNTGISMDSAWKDIQKAVDVAQPGDIIYLRGGIYHQAVSFKKSGLKSAYITLQGYPGEVAILDGSGMDIYGGMVKINKNYIRLTNLEIRNLTTTKKHTMIAGIEISGKAHHIEIRSNKIHNIENHAPVNSEKMGRDAHGILVYGTNPSHSIHHIVIDGNEIYDCILGSSEALVLNGNVENFRVTNNLVHNNDNIGIDFIGFEGVAGSSNKDQARNGICSGNKVYNIDTYNNPSYGRERSAAGIYCDGSKNIIIEENTVYDSNFGIEIASEHGGKSTSNVTVRNNFVHNCHNAGLIMGGYDTKRGSSVGNKIVGNKFYRNDRLCGGFGEICIQYDTKNNIIKDNTFYANTENLFISNIYKKNSGNFLDGNFYYAIKGKKNCKWQWKKKLYTDFKDYQTSTGNDINSKLIFVDE